MLLHGSEVRPYMATHMPKFGKDNVKLLLENLAKADGADQAADTKFDGAKVKDGHKLVGITGLGCINCHTFNGRKSLGVPSVDLGLMAERLRPAWLKSFLKNP